MSNDPLGGIHAFGQTESHICEGHHTGAYGGRGDWASILGTSVLRAAREFVRNVQRVSSPGYGAVFSKHGVTVGPRMPVEWNSVRAAGIQTSGGTDRRARRSWACRAQHGRCCGDRPCPGRKSRSTTKSSANRPSTPICVLNNKLRLTSRSSLNPDHARPAPGAEALSVLGDLPAPDKWGA